MECSGCFSIYPPEICEGGLMSRLAGRQGKRAILVALLISAAALAGAQNPEGAPSSEQVGVLIHDLQGEVRELRAAVSELRAESAHYRAETERLRRRLEGESTVATATAQPPTASSSASDDQRLASLQEEH